MLNKNVNTNKVKNIVMKSVILIFLFVTLFIVCEGFSKENIVLFTNSNQSINFTSSGYTAKDDLTLNKNKGKLTASDELIKNSDNNDYSLYLNRNLCIFKVKNNLTGYVYSSALDEINEGSATTTYASYMSSSFLIEYYKYIKKTEENSQNITQSYMTTVKRLTTAQKEELGDRETYPLVITLNENVKVDYEDITNGIRAIINFQDNSISLTSEITIDNDGLHVLVPDEKITEDKDLLSNIIVMPGMGATYNNETKGYMVIPDGAGALIRYGEIKKPAQQKVSFYGGNMGADLGLVNYDMKSPYNLSANVFGLINGIKQDGVYGIIEDGGYHCDLLISPSGALNIKYNYLACSFTKRYLYLQYGITSKIVEKRNNENINLLFKFLSNDEATYVGMANSYHDYLIDKQMLVKTSKGEYQTRFDYLLSETSQGLIGTKMNVMTNVSDIKEMSDYFTSQGIKQTTILKGWNSAGYSGATPYNIKVNSSAGSKRSFKNLISSLSESGKIYFYNDYLIGYENGNFSKRSDVAKSTQNLKMSFTNENAILYQDYYYLNPKSSYEISNDDLKSYDRLGINSLAINSLGSILFTYLEDKENKTRLDNYLEYDNLMNNITSKMKTGMFLPNVYMYKYLDSYFDMPLFCNSYSYYTDNVPFIPYVLKSEVDMYSSYVNFFALGKAQILRLLDYGVLPSYILTSEASYNLKYTNSVDMFTTNINDWKDVIVNNYDYLKQGFTKTSEARVTEREVLSDGIILLTYDNETKVVINYTNEDYLYLGKTISKTDYIIIGE